MITPTEGSLGRRSLWVTWWPSLTSSLGTRQEISLALLRATFERPRDASNKSGLPGWSPATFAENRRAKKDVEAVHALVLDYDDGTPIEQALEVWGSFLGLLHTTWSHTEEKPRFRVVAVLSRPVTAEEHAVLWAWAERRASSSGHRVDPSCKDPSRLWFMPGVPNGGAYFMRLFEGELLDVEDVLNEASAYQLASGTSEVVGTRYGLGALRSAEARITNAQPGERNNILNREAFGIGQLVGAGAIAREPAHVALVAAATSVGLGKAEAEKTASRALRDGEATPRERSAVKGLPGLPQILLRPELHLVVAEAIVALGADPDTYQRDGQLVFVVRAPTPDGATGLIAGAPQIRAMPASILRERLTRVANWTKTLANGGRNPALPSDPVIEATLARGEWPEGCVVNEELRPGWRWQEPSP